MMAYVDFNDEKLPIGKRKQAYVKWVVSKGTDLALAKKQANKKFGYEKKAGIFAVVYDYGRMHQRSFEGVREIFQSHNLGKYDQSSWAQNITHEDSESEKLAQKYKDKGWEIVRVNLYA